MFITTKRIASQKDRKQQLQERKKEVKIHEKETPKRKNEVGIRKTEMTHRKLKMEQRKLKAQERKAQRKNSDDEAKSLYFIDGKESTREAVEALDSSEIETMNILKGKNVLKKYGDRAEDGVIEVSTKKKK